MEYQVAFTAGFVVFLATAGWMFAASRWQPPRSQRQDKQQGTAWIQVDVSFAVFALIFLAFDMEMIYMFPWAVAYQAVGMIAFWDMLVFAVILTVGLVYAGKRGAFRL